MNPYEAARERLERANRNLKKAKAEAHRILTEAEVEWSEADDNLRRYESAPGIPQPQYRIPDYSQIPGYRPEHSAVQVIDLDTGLEV